MNISSNGQLTREKPTREENKRIMKQLLCIVLGIICCCIIQAQPIDVSYAIKIGGINQWVSVKGQDINKPLLLWLHGGPGSSVMNNADKFTKKLQEHFIVVQWDQRETGKTQSLNKSLQPLTFNLFQQDTHDIIDSLLVQFHYRKLYLVGHSWGTSLGFYIADKYPELLYAFIAISPVINQQESERMTLLMLKEKAAKKGNRREAEELAKVNIPFENGEQLYFDRKWLLTFNGQKFLSITFPRKFILSWAATWLPVFNESAAVNLFVSAPEIKCPVYFFAGRTDYQTHFAITEAYYNEVIAPEKKLYWFEHSGHSIPESEPEKLQDIIITDILPGTFLP